MGLNHNSLDGNKNRLADGTFENEKCTANNSRSWDEETKDENAIRLG